MRVFALALRVSALAAGVARGLDWLGQVADHVRKSLGQLHRLGARARHAFDIAQIGLFVRGDEADRDPFRPRARGAADAVDILFGNVRNLEINDVADPRHVDTARGDIGRRSEEHTSELQSLMRTSY